MHHEYILVNHARGHETAREGDAAMGDDRLAFLTLELRDFLRC